MDYKHIYNSIIQNRIKNKLFKNDNIYTENHHIIPKSLGGSDDSSNLVRLTAREHFICHCLLVKQYNKGTNEWYKMNGAIKIMNKNTQLANNYTNSRIYSKLREDFIQTLINNKIKKINEMFDWIDENKRYPKSKPNDKLEKTYGNIIDNLKYYRKGFGRGLWSNEFLTIAINRGYETIFDNINIECEGIKKVNEICDWIDVNNKIPAISSDDKCESELGRKISCFKSAKNGNPNWKWYDSYEETAIKRNYDTLFSSNEEKAKIKIIRLCDFIDKYNRLPNNKIKAEKKLFSFYKNMISSYNGVSKTSKFYSVYETILQNRNYFYLISNDNKGKHFLPKNNL